MNCIDTNCFDGKYQFQEILSSQRMLTTGQKDTQFQKKKNILIPNKNGDFKVADGIMNKDQLLSLTLRQLRQEASKLSVPLYSRKTKAVLVDLILKYQEKSSKKVSISSSQPKYEETFESNTFNSTEEVKTNVVFLPRDPDWAYVFWQISDADREEGHRLLRRLTSSNTQQK